MDGAEDLPLVDVRDTPGLSIALTQVFLFIEHVNALASLHIGHSLGHERPEVSRIPKDLPGIILWLRERLSRPNAKWFQGSDTLNAALEANIQPKPDSAILGALVRLLLRPAKVGPDRSGLNWKIQSTPRPLFLPRPPSADTAERISERMAFYATGTRLSFTNRLLDYEPIHTKSLAVYYWEEPFDAILIVRLFLSEVLGERGRAADQYLQRWLRTQFDLTYDKRTKYALATICRRFNALFYDSAVPSTQVLHTKRASTLGASLLMQELEKLLSLNADSSEDALVSRRRALGIFLFLRFCRQLRCGYCWFGLQRLQGGGSNEAVLEKYAGLSGSQFTSALRPLGYTYFQSRMFGAILSIPGLSNIFRGGLLPRTNSGRTVALIGPPGVGKTVLALQMMADVARFGGLAIYFSFEESYASVIDRLVTFGLYDSDKFEICEAGENLASVLREYVDEKPGKGLLVLYSNREDASFSVLEAIDSIGKAADGRKIFKALALDSINALEFSSIIDEPSDAGTMHRFELGALINRIEGNDFLGVILAERDDRSLWTLPYLMDTVIDLGLDDLSHMRWLEIKKCRVQDYHPGRHPFRMTDGLGVAIYPSLAARRSSLRGRVRSTASEQRFIPFSPAWQSTLGLDGIREKSSTLIWGPPGGGKTLLLLNLLTEPTKKRPRQEGIAGGRQSTDLGAPDNVLVITFRTPEKAFLQTLERHPALYARWQRIKQVRIRWYSVGVNFSAEQLVSEIWRYFNSSRREGLPVDRVVFDETESAEDFLPTLKGEPMFWPTIFELTSTEAINSFFVCSNTGAGAGSETPVLRLLKSSMDYILHVFEGGVDEAVQEPNHTSRWVAVETHPDLVPGDRKLVVPFHVYSDKRRKGLICKPEDISEGAPSLEIEEGG